MTDFSSRLEQIRERTEAATEFEQQTGQTSLKAADYYRSDVPFLLSLVEDVGEALASLYGEEVDELLNRVEGRCGEDAVKALSQVRDSALKAEYEEEVKAGE